MATRVAGRSGGPKIASILAHAGLAALVGAGLMGCGDEDPSARALSDASTSLRTISPGSVPPIDDGFATAGYTAASTKLASATRDGSDAQKAIASILSAEIEVGRARPALTRLAQIEHEIGSKLTRMMSLETARVSAQQTAEALSGYDSSSERASIDQRASQLQEDLAQAQREQQALQQQLESLGSQVSDLEGRVSTIRGEESSLRDQALREEPIAAAQTTEQARETGRRADALEVQASTLDAQRSVLRPQIDALGVRIDAINAQLAILSEARESVAQQARRSAEDAAAAQNSAREFSAELVALAGEIGALHQTEAKAALEEARDAFGKAASQARQASARVIDGTLASAGARRSLGDVLARRAGSLEQTAGAFRGLAGRADGEQGRRLSALADQLSQQAQTLKQDAIAAYQEAVSGFNRVRAPGATGERLRETASALERAIERLGGRAAGSDDPMGGDEPADFGDDQTGGDSPEPGAEETPPQDG